MDAFHVPEGGSGRPRSDVVFTQHEGHVFGGDGDGADFYAMRSWKRCNKTNYSIKQFYCCCNSIIGGLSSLLALTCNNKSFRDQTSGTPELVLTLRIIIVD